MGKMARKPRTSARRQWRRTSASSTHAARRATPAVLRRKPALASTNDAISRNHGLDENGPSTATSTKRTLMRTNGISVWSRSESQIVLGCSRVNATAVTANRGRTYLFASASTARAYPRNSTAYKIRSHGPTTAAFVEPRARWHTATIAGKSGGYCKASGEPGSLRIL